jgi:hypothetical protein
MTTNYPPAEDTEFYEEIVRSVRASSSGNTWEVTNEKGWVIGVPSFTEREPKAGDVIRYYGKGSGYTVRGVVIDDWVYFYRTVEQDQIHHEEQTYGKNCAEMLQRWDAGKSIWTIESGGFSPGYEQALQLTMMEVLRVLLKHKPDTTTWVETIDDATKKAIDDEAGKAVAPLGLSGAQWGAAVNLALMFYRRGPIETIKAHPADRHLMCSRNVPTLPVPAPEEPDGAYTTGMAQNYKAGHDAAREFFANLTETSANTSMQELVSLAVTSLFLVVHENPRGSLGDFMAGLGMGLANAWGNADTPPTPGQARKMLEETTDVTVKGLQSLARRKPRTVQ